MFIGRWSALCCLVAGLSLVLGCSAQAGNCAQDASSHGCASSGGQVLLAMGSKVLKDKVVVQQASDVEEERVDVQHRLPMAAVDKRESVHQHGARSEVGSDHTRVAKADPIPGPTAKELPGASDAHGPDALGDSANMRTTVKWLEVGIISVVSILPISLVAYYYIKGPADTQLPTRASEQPSRLALAIAKSGGVLATLGDALFRIGMFTVYFWFGILKVAGISPAEPLVQIVFRKLPFSHIASAELFCKWAVGAGECMMGFCYLLTLSRHKQTRYYCTCLSILFGMAHMITVSLLPMVLLPNEVWQEGRFPYALTFEGQYIMKNVILLSGFMLMGRDLVDQSSSAIKS